MSTQAKFKPATNASYSATILVASKFNLKDCSRISHVGDAKQIPTLEPCFGDEPLTCRVQVVLDGLSLVSSVGNSTRKSARF